MLSQFRQFLFRGNVVELAVAFILGAAFTTVVRSFADDILMPPIGLLFGDTDFTKYYVLLREGPTPKPYATLAEARDAGAVTWTYGRFITNTIIFFLTALPLFFIVRASVKIQQMRQTEETPSEPTTKECSHCFSVINVNATRCAHCTADLPAA